MFFSKVQPKAVLAAKDVRDRLGRELVAIGAVGRKTGPHTLLGKERAQLDIMVGLRAFDALISECEQTGTVIDPALEMYLTVPGKRLFAAQTLARLSQFRPHHVPGCPIQTLYKSTGVLIRMRKQTPQKRGTGGRFWYISKDFATDLELQIAFNTHRQNAETRKRFDNAQADIWAPALKVYPHGKPFSEAYAEEAQAYLQRRA